MVIAFDAYPMDDNGYSDDFNGDGVVDNLVYELFKGTSSDCLSRFAADANHDGEVDALDKAIWEAQN